MRPKKRNLTIPERIELVALYEKFGIEKTAMIMGLSKRSVQYMVEKYKKGEIFSGKPAVDEKTEREILYLYWRTGWNAKRIKEADITFPSHRTIQRLINEHLHEQWFVFTDGRELYIRHKPSKKFFSLSVAFPPTDTKMPVRSWFEDRLDRRVYTNEYKVLQRAIFDTLEQWEERDREQQTPADKVRKITKAAQQVNKRIERLVKLARKDKIYAIVLYDELMKLFNRTQERLQKIEQLLTGDEEWLYYKQDRCSNKEKDNANFTIGMCK